MTAAARAYRRNLSLAILVYGVVLVASRVLLRSAELATPVQILVSLSPMIGVVLFVRAILIFSRSWDEMQTRITMEAVIMAASVVAFGSFAWGFLEGDVGAPRLPTIWIMPIMFAALIPARIIATRRYK
ncbi:MAG: hypothetical protein ACFB22_12430 [Rhodothalassiaceae bacterium]